MSLRKEQLHLATVVDEAVATAVGLFTSKGLRLETDVPLELPLVHADRTRVRQTLINLLSNAARFTERGGVKVRAWAENTDVVTAVSDTGTGIAPDSLSTVFEEFRQVDINGERRLVGNGIGLALSRRFVELHGGSMWVESRLDEGSTFYFTLPTCGNVIAGVGRTKGDHWVASVAGAEAVAPAVLVLDRDGEAASLLARYLDGHRVLAVDGIEKVRRLTSETSVRAVMIASPSSTANWQAIRQLGEVVPGVPVVSCSFVTSRGVARNLGISDYLVKPVRRDQVLLALRRLRKAVRSVLVVDDDVQMLRLVGRMVRSGVKHCTVLEAQSGLEALAILETKRPDVVLLDLVMPDIGGDEVLRRMRSSTTLRDVPVVLVTARDLTEQTVVAEAFAITRRDGLSVAEFIRCLRASLDSLEKMPSSTFQPLRAGPTG
jgi:CheY-like chemotaxis protein